MKKLKGTHKQSKYFTIMLIPDSSAKVRRLHVPYWVLGVLGVPFVCILLIAGLFQTKVVNLENLLNHSNARLSETIDEKGRLQDSLTAVIPDVAPPLEQTPEQPVHEPDEEMIAEILERLDSIDYLKHGIIGVFNELAASDVPFHFDEDTLYGGVIRAQGGAITGGPEDIIAELDNILLSEMASMQTLSEIAEDIEAYFMARPSGWPVASTNIGSEFGFRVSPFTGGGLEMHEGVDFSMPEGSEVYATAYGVVTFAGLNTGGFGYLVIITHDFDYDTYYAHNSEVLVSVGDEVSRGQLIALTGNTGRSTSPHLHYEVRNNNLPQNPRDYLE